MAQWLMACVLGVVSLLPWSAVRGESLIEGVAIRPMHAWEMGAGGAGSVGRVLGDRFEYWADDVRGQFHVVFPQPADGGRIARATVRLVEADGGKVLDEKHVDAPGHAKAHVLVGMSSLAPGGYALEAASQDQAGAAIGEPVRFNFTRSKRASEAMAFPADGVELIVEPLDQPRDAVWPVRLGVPLPAGAVRDAGQLVLHEDGKPVASQVKPLVGWSPGGPGDMVGEPPMPGGGAAGGGGVQWVHVDVPVRYRGGKPATYRLKQLAKPVEVATPLRAEQRDDRIVVDTGSLRFEVLRKGFSGIHRAWFDATGKGKYRLDRPVLDGEGRPDGLPYRQMPEVPGAGGPYIIDGRHIRFDARLDNDATVVIEEQGPQRVTILAEGWYRTGNTRIAPICRFQTRIIAYAGQPFVRVRHSTIIAYDTRQHRLRDVGFHLPLTEASHFSLGADGKAIEGQLPKTGSVSIHQDRHDRFRLLGLGDNAAGGERSDGWISVSPINTNPADAIDLLADQPPDTGKSHGTAVAVMLRDVWQKFPKELEASSQGMTVHFWPRSGHRAYDFEEEMSLANIYKGWCFHQGVLLDLNFPAHYYEKLLTYPGMTENVPEHPLNSNAQGVVIGNEFAVWFGATGRMTPRQTADNAALLHCDPVVSVEPRYAAATGAMGPMAGRDDAAFPDMEQAVEQGFLSFNRSVERGNAYGMWNYADTHTYWDVRNHHAQLHRVWINSHYHHVTKAWLMNFRDASPPLRRWARISTDHYINVDTINYADPDAPLMFHSLGAMYHCKGFTHWGSEAYGMHRRDGHAGLTGHWVDPDGPLWSWLIDGNDRAGDVYRVWHEQLIKRGPPLRGVAREINTSLAYVVSLYRATWDADLLPAIHGMGHSLRTARPLDQQLPGPMWHPLWINRYYELTRDPEYVPFILEHGKRVGIFDTWTLALSSLAYELSGDVTYLTNHFPLVSEFPRRFFRSPGDMYDWYGVFPGPQGSRWGYMTWGYFRRQLERAGISEIQPPRRTGYYGSSPGGTNKPSSLVIAHQGADAPFTATVAAHSFGGNVHAHIVRILNPRGTVAAEKSENPRASRMRWEFPIEADKQTGLYRIEVTTHMAAMHAPLTDLPMEAQLLDPGRAYASAGFVAWIAPLDQASPPRAITLTAMGDYAPSNIIVRDANGGHVAQVSLFSPRPASTMTVPVDIAKHPLPWQLDSQGHHTLSCDADGPLLLAVDRETLDAIRPLIIQQGTR